MMNNPKLVEFIEDENQPLDKRIELAFNQFSSINLQVVKKQECILEWIKTGIFNEITASEDKLLFMKLLHQCITCTMDLLSNPQLASPILEVLLSPNLDKEDDIIKCSLELLKNSNFLKYFVYHLTELANIIECCVKRIQYSELYTKEIISIRIIKSLTYVYENTLHNHELKTVFVNEILISIAKLGSDFNLKYNGHDRYNNCISFDQVAFKLLFMEVDFRKQFTNNILSAAETENDDLLTKHVNHVIEIIRNYPAKLKTDEISIAYGVIFDGFLLSKASNNSKLKVFLALNYFVGMKPVQVFSYTPSVTFNENMMTINMLIESLLRFDIPLDSQVEEVTLMKWLTAFVNAILEAMPTNFSPIIILLLKNALALSPVLLENILRKFTKVAILMKKTDPEVITAYSDLCLFILDVHIKFNKVNKLISAILMSIKENPTECIATKFDVLPNEVFDKLQSAVTNFPNTNQNIYLFKTLLFHLEKDCIETLEKSDSEEINSKHILLFDIVVCMLTRLINGTRIMDFSVPDAAKEKFILLMDELASLLKRYGRVIVSKELDPELIGSFLRICLVWGDMQMVFMMTCELAPRKVEKQNILFSNSATNFVYLHPYLPASHWELIIQRIFRSGNEDCQRLVNHLVLQKIKALPYLEDELEGPFVENVSGDGPAMTCAHYLVTQPASDWLFNHASDFADLLTHEDVRKLSEKIIKYCKTIEKEEVIRILSGEICEIRSLLVSMVNDVFYSLSQTLKKYRLNEMTNLIDLMAFKDMIDLENEEDTLTSVESNLERIGTLVSNDIEFKARDVKFKIQLIEKDIFILTQLPAKFLKKSNRTMVVLLTLSLLKNLLKSVNNFKSECPVLNDLQKFLLNILPDSQLPKTIDCGKIIVWFYQVLKYSKYRDRIMQRLCEADVNQNISTVSIKKFVDITVNKSEAVDLVVSYFVNSQVRNIRKRKNVDNNDRANEIKKMCYQHFDKIFKNSKNNIDEEYEKSLESRLSALTILLQEAETSQNLDEFIKLEDHVEKLISDIDHCEIPAEKCSEFLCTYIYHIKVLKKDLLIDLWNSHWFRSNDHVLCLMLEKATKVEYTEMLENLYSYTEVILSTSEFENIQLDSISKTWKIIFNVSVKESKMEVKNIMTSWLSTCISKYVITRGNFNDDTKKLEIQKLSIQLLSIICRNKKIKIKYQVVDTFFDLMSMTLMNSCPSNELFLECIELLFIFCAQRSSKLLTRIPIFYIIYKFIYTEIMNRVLVTNDETGLQLLVTAAHKLEKLTDNLVKCRKDFVKTAINAVSDLLHVIMNVKFKEEVEMHMKNIIFLWISMCDSHGLQYLSTAMSSIPQQLFKQYWDEYKKFHKFTGKV